MKKFVLLIIIFFLSPCASNLKAQLLRDYIRNNGVLGGQSDSVLIDAITPGLYIIRQQYQLKDKDKGTLHGKNEENYFGENFTLGVKTAEGLLIGHQLFKPWEGDKDYEKVNNHGKYIPQLYKTTFLRDLRNDQYQEINLDLDKPEYLETLGPDSILFRHIEERADFGFSVATDFGNSDGYVVMAYRDSTVNYPSMKVSLKVNKKRIDDLKDCVSVPYNPTDFELAIGGIYIIPVIERIGLINCKIAGVVIQDKKGNWVISSLIATDNNASKGEAAKSQIEDDTVAINGVSITTIKE